MRDKRAELTSIVLVILSSVLLYFVGLGSIGITDPGEAYYAEAGREMLESGDYITPHLNYQIYFSKPILTFWLMSFAFKMFGVSEFAARLFFAVLVLLLIISTYCLGQRLRNWRCGAMASLITASAPLLLALAKLSPIDIAFACFLDLSAFALVFCTIFEESIWWPAIYIALALAALTKGPAAIVLMLLGMAVFVLCERAPRHVYARRLKRLDPFVGMALFTLIAVPWYIAVGRATGGLFPKVFFYYENMARFAGHTNLAHTTWYHYLIVLLYGFFPWVLFLVPSLNLALTKRQSNSLLQLDSGGAQGAIRSALLFLCCWSVAVLLFFSFSHTQLDTYLLPVIAPMGILVANFFERKLEEAKADLVVGSQASLRALFWVSSLFLILGCAALFGALIAATRIVEDDIKTGAIITAMLLTGGYIAQYWLYRKQRYGLMFACILSATVLASAVGEQTAFALLDAKGQRDLRQICLHLRDRKGELAIFKTFKPSIMFYCRRPVDSFFHTSQLVPIAQVVSGPDGGYRERPMIIVHDKTLPELQATAGPSLKLIERCGSWSVWQANQAKLEKVQTLESIFANPEAFQRAVSGQSDWGPLTVPYAGGDRSWFDKAPSGL